MIIDANIPNRTIAVLRRMARERGVTFDALCCSIFFEKTGYNNPPADAAESAQGRDTNAAESAQGRGDRVVVDDYASGFAAVSAQGRGADENAAAQDWRGNAPWATAGADTVRPYEEREEVRHG